MKKIQFITFIFFSVFRCYVETGLLAKHSFFSYYVALHHTLWNASTILVIILLMHLILKVPIVRLIWVMYGITLMAIPLLYAMVTQEHLQLEYLEDLFLRLSVISQRFAGHMPKTGR